MQTGTHYRRNKIIWLDGFTSKQLPWPEYFNTSIIVFFCPEIKINVDFAGLFLQLTCIKSSTILPRQACNWVEPKRTWHVCTVLWGKHIRMTVKKPINVLNCPQPSCVVKNYCGWCFNVISYLFTLFLLFCHVNSTLSVVIERSGDFILSWICYFYKIYFAFIVLLVQCFCELNRF